MYRSALSAITSCSAQVDELRVRVGLTSGWPTAASPVASSTDSSLTACSCSANASACLRPSTSNCVHKAPTSSCMRFRHLSGFFTLHRASRIAAGAPGATYAIGM